MGIAGHRPTIVLYNHSISPSMGGHLEQRARRAATGSYSGGGRRGLLPLNRDRRRRHAGATESSQKDAFRSQNRVGTCWKMTLISCRALRPSCCRTLIIKSQCYIFVSSRRERVTVATNPLAAPDNGCCFISRFYLTMP